MKQPGRYTLAAGLCAAVVLAVCLSIFIKAAFAQDEIIIRPLGHFENVNTIFFVYNAKDADDLGTAAHIMTDFDMQVGTDRIEYFDFVPPHTLLTGLLLQVDVDALNNDSVTDQWQIEYTETFSSTQTWIPLTGGSGGNPTRDPGDPVEASLSLSPVNLADDLAVRILTTNVDPSSLPTDLDAFLAAPDSFPQLRVWDIRVSAIFDGTAGGEGLLNITTGSALPDGVVGELYPPPDGGGLWIDASGGFPANYQWCYSGSLPSGLTLRDRTDTTDIGVCDPPVTASSDYILLTEGPISSAGGGSYQFTVKVQDGTQNAEKTFTLNVQGLGIIPTGSKLPTGKKGSVYPPTGTPNLNFTPVGGTGPYFWCYSGTLPDGLTLSDGTTAVPACAGSPTWQSTNVDGHVTLSGPTNRARTYNFSLTLKDSSTPPYQITKNYILEVLTAGVTIKPNTFSPLTRGIPYGIYGGEFPLYLEAVNVTNSPATTWTVPAYPSIQTLPGGLSQGNTISDDPSAPVRFSRVEINGTVTVDPAVTASGEYPFTARVTDPNNPIATTDDADFVLTVLPRATHIVKAPPSSATSNTGILITYSSDVAYEQNMRVGSVLTNTEQTVSAPVLNYMPANNQILIESSDVTKWEPGDSIEGPGAPPFSATISESKTVPYLPFTVSGSGGAPTLLANSLKFTYSPSTPSTEDMLKVGDTLYNYTKSTVSPGVFSAVVYYSYNHSASNEIAVADTTTTNWQTGDWISTLPPASFPAGTPPPPNYFNAQIASVTGVQSPDSLISPPGLPQYTYAWYVTEVGQSPKLDVVAGTINGSPTVPPYDTGPLRIGIIFESNSAPVTGTYDIQFWAQDYIARTNPPDSTTTPPDPPDHPVGTDANDAFEFTPATVRITVNAPAQVDTRPIKLRQEIFR
ncbi:MAG: hypothetical protein Kow0099_22370 [Candidatus Abyssubacteria bacterium]